MARVSTERQQWMRRKWDEEARGKRLKVSNRGNHKNSCSLDRKTDKANGRILQSNRTKEKRGYAEVNVL